MNDIDKRLLSVLFLVGIWFFIGLLLGYFVGAST